MSLQKVKCENKDCLKNFTLNVKVGPETDGLYEVYFICPFCNKRYHCYYENQQSTSIQDQINQYNAQYQNTKVIKKGMDFAKEYNKRNDLLKKINKLRTDKRRILEKINKNSKIFKK